METRILHGFQKFEGNPVRSLRGCFLWSFIPIDPLVTEEKKLTHAGRLTTDAGQKAITITHLEQSSGELKTSRGLCNLLTQRYVFLRVCDRWLRKALWEKEKLFIMSNFSFTHNVFYPIRVNKFKLFNFDFVVCRLFQIRIIQNCVVW